MVEVSGASAEGRGDESKRVPLGQRQSFVAAPLPDQAVRRRAIREAGEGRKGDPEHITDAFRSRKMFRDTTEMLQKHPTLSTSPTPATGTSGSEPSTRTTLSWPCGGNLTAARRHQTFSDCSMTSANVPRHCHEYDMRSIFKGTVFKQNGLNVWDTQFTEMAGPGAFNDPKIVRKDIDEIDKQAKLVVLYANTIVAHRTPESVQTTLKHINDSLEAIEKVLQKYYVLLTGSGLMGAEPSIINPWQRAFTVPWIPPEEDE